MTGRWMEKLGQTVTGRNGGGGLNVKVPILCNFSWSYSISHKLPPTVLWIEIVDFPRGSD
jgi:hypothetical protein